MKATELLFPVVMFIIQHMDALAFNSAGEILLCDHSNESYRGVLSCEQKSSEIRSTAGQPFPLAVCYRLETFLLG